MRTCGLGRKCLCSWSVSVRGRVILLGSTTTSRTWATTPAISSRLYSSAQTDSKIEDDWSISVKVSGEYCILVNLILLRTNCHFFYCILRKLKLPVLRFTKIRINYMCAIQSFKILSNFTNSVHGIN